MERRRLRGSLREKERQLKVLLQGPQAGESRNAGVSRVTRVWVHSAYMGRRRRSEVQVGVVAGGGSGGCRCGNGGETGHVLPGNWAVVRTAFTIGEGDGGPGRGGGGVGREVK